MTSFTILSFQTSVRIETRSLNTLAIFLTRITICYHPSLISTHISNMSEIFETPLPEPPADLDGLSSQQFQYEVGILHPIEWREYMKVLHNHAQQLHVNGVDLKAEVEALSKQLENATGRPVSSDGSEPIIELSADAETRNQIWIREISIYMCGLGLERM